LKRRDVNNIYRKYFKNNIKVSVFKSSEEFCYSNHWLTSLLFNEEVSNTKIKTIKSTLALHKIETRFLWKPLHTQPLFCNELFYGKDTSEKLFKRGLSVPSSSHLKSEDLNIICETINKLL